MSAPQQEEIAIIGMGCKVPGANNCDEFWRLLENGENHVIDIPKERWNTDAFYDKDKHAVGKSYAKRAGLLKDPLAFDNKLFNIMDFEADQLDPQQRYVLECSYMAMEDAGITKQDLAGSNTGVYVGVMNNDYESLSAAQTPLVDGVTVTGINASMIPARVNFVFDLRGPAMVIDTACSSGLIAIHVASQALLTGDCDMAFCGGTNFIMSPDVFVHLSKANMLSPSGQVHTFSDKADGYTRGEGCGMVILKRLKDAVKDGNFVYATIKTGSNHDGHTVTPISAPSEAQQTKLLHQIYEQSGIQLDNLEYIEAHGTGTPVGDPVEVNALGNFFKSKNSVRTRHIGSVKTNIGHLESAAGIAGLIKVLLMMKYSKIVPNLSFDQPNPKIDFDGMKLKVPIEVLDWPTQDKIACVNSFGFGGTNCHAVVKSFRKEVVAETEVVKNKSSSYIVCFSAKGEKSLEGSLQDFVDHPSIESLDLRDVSYTSTVHRHHYNVRHAVVAETMSDLRHQLDSEIQNRVKGSKLASRTRIVFVFGGMGTAWTGMCKEMMHQSNVFMQTIVEIDRCLSHYVSWSLKERLENNFDINDVIIAPIAIFACQIGLGKVWENLGVIPDCVVGQSVGEVAAAFFAGILSMDDAVKIIYYRTSILAKVKGGGMVMVRNIKTESVKELVQKHAGKACVSVESSPVACVISGDKEFLPTIKHELQSKEEQIRFTDLQVQVAYHSHHVEQCKEELKEKLNDITPTCPQIDMISTVTGKIVSQPLGPIHWADNLREPVLFCDALKNSVKEGPTSMFIELGPKPVMVAHSGDIFPDKGILTGVSMSEKSEWKTFLLTLACVYELGKKIKWENLPNEGRVVTPIPRYCFSPRRILKSGECTLILLAGVKRLNFGHPFLFLLEVKNMYKIVITKHTFPTIYDHQVSGRLIIPGALYAEAGLDVILHQLRKKAPLYSVSVQFLMPFSFSREDAVELDVVIQDSPQGLDEEPFENCNISIKKENKTLATICLHPHRMRKEPASVNIARILANSPNTVSHNEIYKKLEKFGFVYGPKLSLLREASGTSTTRIAKMYLPQDIEEEVKQTTIHPAVIDAMLQTSVLIVGENEDKDIIPQSIGKLTPYMPVESEMYIYTKLKKTEKNRMIYNCKLLTLDGEVIAELQNLAIKVVAAEEENKYRCMWKPVEIGYPTYENKGLRSLFITDRIPAKTPSDLSQQCIEYDVMKSPDDTVAKRLKQMLKKRERFAAINVIINTEVDDSEDGAKVLTKLLNLCLMIKEIYRVAADEALTIPINFFTKRAFPFQNEPENINPIMTSIWGMIRSALQEQIYTNARTVDLHLPEDKCTFPYLESVVENINGDSTLKNYPEWLVSVDRLYVNQIVRFEASTQETSFRENYRDESQRVILMSREPMTPTKTFFIQDNGQAQAVMENFTEMDVLETAVQSPDVFRVQIPYNRFGNEETPTFDGYPIYALEHVGTLQDKSQDQFISCYPAPISSKISVPEDSIFEKGSFRPGDLTRLIVLWSLSQQVTTNNVTILASPATNAFSFILRQLLTTTGREIKSFHIVMIDDLDDATVEDLREAVISLELLDEAMTSILARNWKKPKQFITVASLLSADSNTFFSIKFPMLQIKSVDTQDLFLPRNIITVLPQIKQWIQQNSPNMDQIAIHLHKNLAIQMSAKRVKSNLHELLHMQVFSQENTLVRVGKTELFRQNAVYIVVGGLTGLGSLIVRLLAENGAGNIAILNRREAEPEHHKIIDELSASSNCNIKAFRGDVKYMHSAKSFMVSVGQTFPNAAVKGVFFGAAVLDDKLLLDTDRTIFSKVLLPKVTGAWNFHQLTKDLPLDYFVLQSSVTSVFGNPGQTNYGAGNAFMDGLAHYRRHRKLSGQSINWGALDTGLLANNPKVKDHVESQGFVLMNEQEISESLLFALLLNHGQITLCKFNEDVLHKRMKKGMLGPYQYRLKALLGASGGETRMKEDDLIQLQNVSNLPPEQRAEVYERYVMNLAKQVLDTETLGADSNLQDLGLNSINFLAMMNQIFKDLSCRLPPVIFLSSNSTVTSIAMAIENNLSKRHSDDPVASS